MRTLMILALMLAFSLSARAQTTTTNCMTAGAATNCTSIATPAPDYSYLHNAGKDAMTSVGAQLGKALNVALNVHPVSLVLAIKCGTHARFAVVTYSNGTTKQVPLDAQVSADDRAMIAATLPQVRIVDLSGCDE
jgi:hypothetical protein